jgi:cellulose synthase/poly-beta-1,6-N-acetylglucosamine synthase-like glycosyltransferase
MPLSTLDIVSIFGSVFTLYFSFVYVLIYFFNRKKFSSNPPLPKKLPKVSIIVPAYNEEGTIALTLKSLLNLDYPKKLLEIIAVNDGSDDGTRKIMESFRNRGVKVISKVNGGKASALNAGIKKSIGEIIVCMDADSVVDKNALKKTLGYFSNPEIAAVASSVKVLRPKNVIQKFQFLEYLYNILLRKALTFLDSVFVVPGPFGLYRKSVLEKVGLFESKNLTEDMEITMRIQSKGYRVEAAADAFTYTVSPSSIRKLVKQRIRWYRGFLINSKKYKELYLNPKFGDLGVFTLPAYVLLIFILFVLILSMSYMFASILFHFFNVRLISGIFLTPIEILNPILYTSALTVLWFTSIAISLIVVYLSFKISREKIKLKIIPIYAISALFYGFILAFTWLVSISKELKGEKIKWER